MENGRGLASAHFFKSEALHPALLGLSFELHHVGLFSAGITNCEFHTGRAEKILPQLLKSKEDGQLIVAVLNPARAGLRKDDGFPATEQIMSTHFSPLCPHHANSAPDGLAVGWL